MSLVALNLEIFGGGDHMYIRIFLYPFIYLVHFHVYVCMYVYIDMHIKKVTNPFSRRGVGGPGPQNRGLVQLRHGRPSLVGAGRGPRPPELRLQIPELTPEGGAPAPRMKDIRNKNDEKKNRIRTRTIIRIRLRTRGNSHDNNEFHIKAVSYGGRGGHARW